MKPLFSAGILSVLVFCTSNVSFGQYTPKEERVALADSLLVAYGDKDDEEVVALTSDIEFTFKINTEGNVEAQQVRSDHIISVVDENAYEFVYAQNNYSKINSVYAYTGKKQKKARRLETFCISNFSESIFDSDQEACPYQYYFTRIGEEAKFKTVKVYTDIKYLTMVDLYEYHPMVSRTVTFKVPSWLEVEFHKLNTDGQDISYEKKASGSFTNHIFTIKNIEGYRNQNWSPGRSWYAPSIVPVFKKYTHNGQEKALFASIDDQYKWYKGLVDDVDNRSSTFHKTVTALTEGNTSDAEKISSIFYWVQDNIRYIAFERGLMGFRPEPAYKVYSKRYGDCKGMANLTKEMLTLAGYDARLCWIGTNNITADMNYSFPSLANDNHMICMVKLDGKNYFLDPTESFVAFGDVAARIQGRKTMVENGSSFEILEIPTDASSVNKTKIVTALNLSGDSLIGSAHRTYYGEEKRGLLQQYDYIENQERTRALEMFLSNEDKNITISDYNNTALNEREGTMELKFDFILRNRVIDQGKKRYVNMVIERDFEEFDLEEDRITGYDLKHNRMLDVSTSLTVPAGYKVASLPEDVSFENDYFSVDFKYEEKDGKISFTRVVELKERFIRLESLKDWNETIAKINRIYGAYVVLEKA